MVRPYLPIRSVPWKIRVPVDLAAAVEESLLNPLTGRPKYGEKSALVVALIRKYLEDIETATNQLRGDTQ
jgi:hypothetical protein